MVSAADWVLVTNNAIEFRGRYREIDIHPGVIFIVPSVRRVMQMRLFSVALDWVADHPDMVNRALDIALAADGEPSVTPYALP